MNCLETNASVAFKTNSPRSWLMSTSFTVICIQWTSAESNIIIKVDGSSQAFLSGDFYFGFMSWSELAYINNLLNML